ncbi:MAG: glycosyltransferase family 39 protein, partial [Deltaproteobacteria bacterium]|nr:glycosyltransferase family 39 protein [Deltaproteobacteria bacterium]
MLNLRYPIFFLLVLLSVGIFRIALTYSVFNQTADEPLHITRGMEWLQRGSYSHLHHPPLAPVFFGIGPFIDGVRIDWVGDKHIDGNQILYHNGDYFRNLTLSRLGALPFFLLASMVVWFWSRELFGKTTAALSTLIFTTLPIVLGHSGLATTDIAITATLTLTLYCFYRWLEERSLKWTAALGFAAGLSIISKFSALLFLPSCILSMVLLRWIVRMVNSSTTPSHPMGLLKSTGMSLLTAVLVVWAGYRFSLGTLANDCSLLYQHLVVLAEPYPLLGRILDKLSDLRIIPAHELISGFFLILAENTKGHASYFLGRPRWSVGGTWLFFPVVFLIKSPIPFLILSAGGLGILFKKVITEKDWRLMAPPVAATAIFLIVLPSDINAGLRHILPVFPLISIVAGFALNRLFSNIKYPRAASALAVGLLLWHLSSGVICHPDYLAYFNGLAGRHPERIVVDSDIDWGQDLARLSKTLKEKNISELSL